MRRKDAVGQASCWSSIPGRDGLHPWVCDGGNVPDEGPSWHPPGLIPMCAEKQRKQPQAVFIASLQMGRGMG